MSNNSDFSSNASSELNKKGSNNNMSTSLMSHDSYVHYNVGKLRKKDNLLKVFAFLLVLLLVLLAIFITLYFHTVVKVGSAARKASKTTDTDDTTSRKKGGNRDSLNEGGEGEGGKVVCVGDDCSQDNGRTCNNKECVKISARKCRIWHAKWSCMSV